MKKILFIESSPRKDRSITSDVAAQLMDKLTKVGEFEIDTIDLWNVELPHMSGTNLAAKYAIFEGKQLSQEQEKHWAELNRHTQRFSQADIVVVAAPTWNWGVPYVLKHYIDVVTQPGLTFSWSPETGYTSLLNPKKAVLITSSGGDYTQGSGNEDEDFVIKYMQLWLGTCMGCDVDMINMTLSAAGQEFVDASYKAAKQKIADFAESYAVEMA
ncbi:FMN-dependent NADH-azoreductase [Catenovulum sp. SX2]|uniref:FMN-dependent NADH-azoreductase n=1 Tax=Catenovulum sp. SX2 TaxID=3398614 RepID=UPI003F845A04